MNREISRSVSRDAGGFTSCGELARQARHANFVSLHTAGRPQREAPVIESTFWKVESESRVGGCSPVSPAPIPATFLTNGADVAQSLQFPHRGEEDESSPQFGSVFPKRLGCF